MTTFLNMKYVHILVPDIGWGKRKNSLCDNVQMIFPQKSRKQLTAV